MSTLAQSLWLLDGEGKMGYKTGRVITVVLVGGPGGSMGWNKGSGDSTKQGTFCTSPRRAIPGVCPEVMSAWQCHSLLTGGRWGSVDLRDATNTVAMLE